VWPDTDYFDCIWAGRHQSSQRHTRAACYVPTLDNETEQEYTQTMAKSHTLIQAESALAQAQAAVRAAEAAVRAALKTDPAEPPVGTLIKLKVQYRAYDKEYTYTALRTDNGWLISGRRYEGQLWSWEDVLHLADKNVGKRARLAVQGDSRVL